MKIKHLKVSALFMTAALLTSSCVGSFSLFNRVAKWNMRATNCKFLNEIIFLLYLQHMQCVQLSMLLYSIPSNSGQAITHWRRR